MNAVRPDGHDAHPPRDPLPAPAPRVPDRRIGQAPRMAASAVLVVGGVAGCLARYGVFQAWPTPVGGWPLGTFLINISGCLGLGFLLEHLTRRGPDVGRRRLVRLGLGTGFLGTYTTYSTLAVEVDLLTRGGDVVLALGYASASLLAGLALAAAGVALAGALDAGRQRSVGVAGEEHR